MTIEQLLQALDAWLFEQLNVEELQIIVQVWDPTLGTWYAGIRKQDAPAGTLEYGESTYGSGSIEEALHDLCKELGLIQ